MLHLTTLAIIIAILVYIILGIRECFPRMQYAILAANVYGLSPLYKLAVVIILFASFLIWPIVKLAVIGYNLYQKAKK